MNKRVFFIVLFAFQVIVSKAVEQDSTVNVSLSSFEMLKILNPWLNTSNPAALQFNKGILPRMINLYYGLEDGDFKKVQQGEQLNNYSFQSKSYLKIEDINLFGSFSYDKSYENNLDFSNTNNPYRETPYDMVDTIGGDTYDREFFYLKGSMSKPIGEFTSFGISFDFGIGVSVQESDPRPENKVLDISVSPGFIHSLSKFKFGLNFIYKYYNEEIEVDIVEDDATATIFRMLGPGVYTYHEAQSFNRLYKRNSFGGDGQISYKTKDLNTILGVKTVYFKETVQDGGKGGGASWNYIRNYAEFEGIDWNVYDILQIDKGLIIHDLNANFHLLTTRGTEIIENLEQVGDLDNEDWVFYSDEPKYQSQRIDASLAYRFIKLKTKALQNYTLEVKINYDSYKQEYHIPYQIESYDNALIGFKASKVFNIKNTMLSLSTGIDYKMSLDSKQNFEKINFIYDRILYPDFEMLTNNYYAPIVNFSYEQPLNKLFEKIFFDAKTKLLIGENGQSRIIANFSTGVIF